MNIIVLSIYVLAILYVLLNAKAFKYVGIEFANNDYIANKSLYAVICSLTIVVSFACLCATRLTSSYDTTPYITYYNTILDTPLLAYDGTYGLGFEVLTKVSTLLFRSYYKLYFGLIAIVNILIVLKALNNKDLNPIVGLIVYLSFLGLYYNYIVLRQGLAISFIVLGYSYSHKSLIKQYFCLLMALLFHESAIVVIVCSVLFTSKDYKKQTMLVLSIFALLLYLTKITNILITPVLSFLLRLLPAQLFHKYVLYFEGLEYEFDISIYHLMMFAISCILILKGANNPFFNKMIRFNVFGLLLLGVFSGIPAIIRVSDYLTTATLIPKTINASLTL